VLPPTIGGAALRHADVVRSQAVHGAPVKPHLLEISGEDHHLRIPFMLAVRNHGFRVTAAGTGDPAPFAQAGIEYRRVHFDRFVNPVADLVTIRNLSRLFAEVHPNIIQTYDTKPNLLVPLAAARDGGVPVIRIINGRGWVFSSRSPQAMALRPVYTALYRLTDRSTTANVFEIRDDQTFFGRRPHAPGFVIPGWIDIDAFERALTAEYSADRLRREFGLGAAEIVVTVTRLNRQKGIPSLLDAAALVHATRPNVRFLLVGSREKEGPLAISQAELERHRPYVVAVGARSDVPALLRLADVFAFPTEYGEGVPRVLLEAALAQLPIVATDIAGCRAVVRDGWSGFVVPPRTPPVLAERIVDLLRDRETARTMASRAATLVRQTFGLSTIVTRYIALYEEALKSAHRGRVRPDEFRADTPAAGSP
jgi:glycosyltransferase involved in cell wall biosynthesis